jgi:glycosyltransferase involved in cell wall biosynthesis/tRNA A-37 threonylcarbamoyl transferase component Bud32
LKNYYFEPFDIIVFPIIDWYYRFQRPQQISTQLALHGHRVFYLRTYFLSGTKPAYKAIRSDISITDVHLGLPVHKSNVADQLDENSTRVILDQIDLLRGDFNISKAVCFVDLPFWAPVALELQKKQGWKLVYDSMDHLGGFSNVTAHMLEPEDELIKKSDLILATSHLLFNEKKELNPNSLLVPNAAEFDHFNYSPENFRTELADLRNPIVGYYGAISDWFDTDLVCDLASARPDWSFVLIGNTEGSDVSRLEKLDNVFLLGEKPYDFLPGYLQHFDTCIIPFKKIQLTQATNPVKLFEYLSAGKSIVATDLNELGYYRQYVTLVSSLGEWLEAIELALDDYLPEQVEKRLRFARQNTWDERILLIQDAVQKISQDQITLPTPLPFILPREHLVSSRLLAHHEGVDYWCSVYEKDALVYKQASLDLAEREARFLSQFASDFFPRLLDTHSEGEYSVITLKKIQGQILRDALPHINLSVAGLYNFILHCLSILVELKEKGITHRNVCRDTILVADGKPVLIDFSWAVSDGEPYFAPAGLGGYERPPQGIFSDIFSMGKVLEYVNHQHHHAFDWVISLMTMNDAVMRITDLIVLKTLFQTALKITLEERESSDE